MVQEDEYDTLEIYATPVAPDTMDTTESWETTAQRPDSWSTVADSQHDQRDHDTGDDPAPVATRAEGSASDFPAQMDQERDPDHRAAPNSIASASVFPAQMDQERDPDHRAAPNSIASASVFPAQMDQERDPDHRVAPNNIAPHQLFSRAK